MNGKPYKYGHGWLYRNLPENVVKWFEELFSLKDKAGCYDNPIGKEVLEICEKWV